MHDCTHIHTHARTHTHTHTHTHSHTHIHAHTHTHTVDKKLIIKAHTPARRQSHPGDDTTGKQ